MDELLELAQRSAVEAGELLLEWFARPAQGVGTKSTPTDLVSNADRESEALLIELLSSARPDDGILAEEGGSDASESGLRWIIDPLDGTVNFLFGIPVWCVSLAVQDSDGTLVGVVHDPNRSETFAAARGRGATLNESAIRVSDESDLTQALIGTGFAYDVASRDAQAVVARRVIPSVRDVRRAGSAALDLCWVACARFDGFYEAHMELWDKAAGALIVEEAGGVVTELRAPVGDSHGVVAANARLHPMLEALVLNHDGR